MASSNQSKIKNSMGARRDYLVRLRPRVETIYVSQGRTVFATGRDGFVREGGEQGLFVYQTRLLSRYRYFITLAPGVDPGPPDQGSGLMQAVTEQTLELRLSRYVGAGVHEDVDLTNFAREAVGFDLELEVEADFADQEETVRERRQHGMIERRWRGGRGELSFDYRAENTYAHRGEAGELKER